MHSDAINHDPAHTFMNTGTTISGRPSMGSWLLYGLGSDAEDLPGFVVMTSTGKFGQQQPIAARMWASGFLPSKFQGVPFRSQGRRGAVSQQSAGRRRRSAAGCDPSHPKRSNRIHDTAVNDPEIQTRIAQYEMAFKMQTSVPDLMDISRRAGARARDVRHEGGRRLVRRQLPAGPAAGRARCAVHPALSSRLGPSQRLEAQYQGHRRRSRPGRPGPWSAI